MLREGLLPYWWMLYRHAKHLHQRTDVYRNVEDAFAARQGDQCLKSGCIYLDIGSGSSPVPTFLCRRHHAVTYATEMDATYLDVQKRYERQLRFGESDKFFVQQEDATRLSFADNSLDFITVISTIEHIPGDGDTRSMMEFARVLRPGGRVVVTVPTAMTYTENDAPYYYAGFERRYDPAALRKRLYQPNLKVAEELYMVSPPHEFTVELEHSFSEILQGRNWSDAWYQSGWHDQYSDVSILLTLGFVRLATKPEKSFGACLAFEKM